MGLVLILPVIELLDAGVFGLIMFDRNIQFEEETNSSILTNINNDNLANFFSPIENSSSGIDIVDSQNLDFEFPKDDAEIKAKFGGVIDGDYITGTSASTSVIGDLAANDSLTAASLNLTGSDGDITVGIDNYGVPRIDAASLDDAVYAQGYVHAKDRLWQMEYQRRAAKGTLAEVLGKDALEQDIYVRTLGIDAIAEEAYNNLSLESKQIVDAYTAGVNVYLQENSALPPEFEALGYQPEAWSAIDVMAIAQLQIFSVGTTDGGELRRFELLQQGISPERIEQLLPDYPADAATILSPETVSQIDYGTDEPISESAEQSAQIEQQITSQLSPLFPSPEASNSWVVSGDRSTVNVSPNGSTDFNSSFGASYRQIVDLNELDNSLYINPPGQSGNRESNNYADQLPLWQTGEYLPMSTEN